MNISIREELLPLTPQTYHILTALLKHNVMSGADVARQVSIDAKRLIEPSSGSLYPALRRLKAMRMLSNPIGDPRIYQITNLGIDLLKDETERLEEISKLARERMIDWAARPSGGILDPELIFG